MAEILLNAKIIVTPLSCDIRIIKSPKKIYLNTVQSMSNPLGYNGFTTKTKFFKYKRFKLKREKVFPQKYWVQNLKSSCQPCWEQLNFGKVNIN